MSSSRWKTATPEPDVIPNPNQSPGFPGAVAPYLPSDDYLNNIRVKVVVQNVQVLASVVEPPAAT